MTYTEWCEMNLGYKTRTIYFEDLSIAEHFGTTAIMDTVNMAMKFETDYKNLTELCMVLNHKIWFTYKTNQPRAELYQYLWEKVKKCLETNLKGEQLEYFYRTTD